jgi:hypothetical protein
MEDYSRRPKARKATGLKDGVFWGDIISEYGYDSLPSFNKGRPGLKVIHRHILATYLFGQSWTTVAIGELLKRDHSTVIHSITTVLDAVQFKNKDFLTEIAKIQHLEPEIIVVQSLEVEALSALQKSFEERCLLR